MTELKNMSIDLASAQNFPSAQEYAAQITRECAENGISATNSFFFNRNNVTEVNRAPRIHTCIGKAFPGALLGKLLAPNDFATSTHRRHRQLARADR